MNSPSEIDVAAHAFTEAKRAEAAARQRRIEAEEDRLRKEGLLAA